MIRDLTAHWVQRYGLEEVERWFFEVWNEPNLEASGLPVLHTTLSYRVAYQEAIGAGQAGRRMRAETPPHGKSKTCSMS